MGRLKRTLETDPNESACVRQAKTRVVSSTEGMPEPEGGGVWQAGRAWLGAAITPCQRPFPRPPEHWASTARQKTPYKSARAVIVKSEVAGSHGYPGGAPNARVMACICGARGTSAAGSVCSVLSTTPISLHLWWITNASGRLITLTLCPLLRPSTKVHWPYDSY